MDADGRTFKQGPVQAADALRMVGVLQDVLMSDTMVLLEAFQSELDDLGTTSIGITYMPECAYAIWGWNVRLRTRWPASVVNYHCDINNMYSYTHHSLGKAMAAAIAEAKVDLKRHGITSIPSKYR